MSEKKILLCSIDAPFIGGAGTNSYNLIKIMRGKLKHRVCGLYLYQDENLDRDPHKIGGIYKYNPKKDKIAQIKSGIIKELGGFPDTIMAKNYIAVLMAHKFFPTVKIYFLPSGSQYYSHYIRKFGLIPVNRLIRDLEEGRKSLTSIVKYQGDHPCWPNSCQNGCDCELRAFMTAHVVIPNSEVTERLFKGLFKRIQSSPGISVADKIHPAIETSGLYDYQSVLKNSKYVQFSDRPYDVIFACYNWKRDLKNMELVRKIVRDPRMLGLKVLIAGHHSSLAKPDPKSRVEIVGCVKNDHMIKYLSQSRCYVCPSYYDSYPNMITEADLCGCNIVTSSNVGQYRRVSKELLVGNFNDTDEWIDKVIRSIKKRSTALLIDQGAIIKQLDEAIV